MDINDFNDEEWYDIFQDVRSLVIRSGYSEWDSSAIQALTENQEGGHGPAHSPVEAFRNYIAAFQKFLKAGSRNVLTNRLGQLGELVRNEAGAPVAKCFVEIEGQQRDLSAADFDPDGMIEELSKLLAELYGEDVGFWSDPDEPRGSE